MPGALIINPVVPSLPVNPAGSVSWPTAIGELRTSTQWLLADLVNKYELDTRVYGTSTATAGTVTFISNQSALQLSVTTTNGSTARLRTNTFWRYQVGRPLRVRTTVYHADAGQTNQTRRWGFFDDNDGLFFALSGTTVQVVRRTSTSGAPVETAVAKASWNYDVMDGTGPSAVTLDVTKANVYEIAFDWIGVGYVQFYINGYLVHTLDLTNALSVPYLKIAQLPVAFDVINTGASTASSMTYLAAAVAVENGGEAQFTSFGAFTAADTSVGTTERPVLSIRPKATYNSITNRMLVLPFLMFVSTEGARAGFRLVMNSSLTGASWSSVDATSGVEFDVAATTGTGGQTLLRGFIANTNDTSAPIRLDQFFSERAQGRQLRVDAFATTQDVLSIYAINEAAGSTAMRASISWKEVR